jgi:putative ABC transport system permease protein
MNFRVALRSLKKNPVFTIVALTVLALGIGANTAIFSVVNAVLLRPLPYQHPDRIVSLGTLWLQTRGIGQVSLPDFLDWRAQSGSFEAMSLYSDSPEDVFANNIPQRVNATFSDVQFFKVFGIAPVLGRAFAETDTQQPVAVVSETFFQHTFHGDPGALGKTIKLEQQAFVLIGVMPGGFRFPNDSEVWAFAPGYLQHWGQSRTGHNFRVVGLMKPKLSLEQVRAEMTAIGSRLAAAYPNDDSKNSVAVTPLHDQLVRSVRTTLYLLLAAVALVLLIACANVANLLLAKVAMRKQEIAIRTALGASQAVIVRQLLAEALALAIPAGAIGLLLGWWSAKALAHFSPETLAQAKSVTLDWRVALFAFVVSLLSCILFGLVPAFQARDVDVNGSLHSGGSTRVMDAGMGKLRGGIVVAEIAMSMALLIGSALLIRSLLALSAVDPGYQAQGVSVMDLSYPASTPEDERHAVQFYSSLLQQGSTTPGVQAIAASTALPNDLGNGSNGTFWIEGKPDPKSGDFLSQQAGFMAITPGYFRILGIPLVRGRGFNDRDQPEALQTCIVNQALAKKFFPGEDPIGHRIRTGYDSLNAPFMTIVGIAKDVRQDSMEEPPYPYIYMPYMQHPGPATGMKIMFRGNESVAPTLAAAAHRLNPEIAVEFKPLTDMLDQAFAPSRFRSGLLALFAGLALLLALAGLYGVMSYTVAQRRGEIGVRMALGAQRAQVVRMIVRQGLWLVLPGIFIGAAVALAAARLFVSLVYGVKPSDPATFGLVAVLLAVVALLAMYVPARRAAAVDPMLALRNE